MLWTIFETDDLNSPLRADSVFWSIYIQVNDIMWEVAEKVRTAYEPMIARAVALCEGMGFPLEHRWCEEKTEQNLKDLQCLCHYSVEITIPRRTKKVWMSEHKKWLQEVEDIKRQLKSEFGSAAYSVSIDICPCPYRGVHY